MGNCIGTKEATDYYVYVRTGDRKGAGTDANVTIILYDQNGGKSKEYPLDNWFRNDFESGCTDTFSIKNLKQFDSVSKVEFWRDSSGLGAAWYVDRVMLENKSNKRMFVFPVYRWIKPGYHYVIKHLDTSLPQFDDDKDQRTMELADKQELYAIGFKGRGMPAQVKQIPDDEQFSFDYKWNIATRKIKMIAQSKIISLVSGTWESLAHLKNVYTSEILKEPTSATRWSNDIYFGLQRTANMNHSVIKLCSKIPENLAATEDMLKPFLEGWSLKQVFDTNRLFIVDYKILEGLPCKSDKFMVCAPMALFFLNGEQHLVPIAIQLKQKPAEDNPVFLPTDPLWTWMMAKMWFNNADASYHQSLTHLGFTHLLMEGVVVVTHRNISQSHPLFKLLAPHYLYLIAINTRGLELLVSEGGWVDKTMNIGIKGMFELIRRGINEWRMDQHGTLPEDLRARGMLSPKVLPGYHFRTDALPLYYAINTYVKKYVKLYYDTPEKITSDWEIQNWAGELVKPREEGGCGLLGVPGNGKIENQEQLIVILTSIIYTCSVAHAATNFPQYDEYAFPPNYPASLAGKPPTDKTPLEEKDILKALPDKPTTLDVMVVTKILSDKGTKSLGDFEVQYIFDPPARQIVKEFREELKEISRHVKEKNKTRNPPYEWLDPEVVPNSISI
ncbi:allene oxide synthase-lipoxygenase protein-like isoform X2 [Mizuhopecten yessoensis]|uniref:Allene oxide synthase-lipoxygenase protein n=1 Tax=Mizuhopecten yessoensis TaxID=6573 RepID=A0A210Q651_MIZYE|nr:allene oxide synthase-lipoxygenase protein-like isoform X2 [Mizuhopecten yessoensis]OWF44208.1 Allene oxide synthase-lipoxygenase protein [Mizuhopecten yessoensis]